jgi:hypothetical protein
LYHFCFFLWILRRYLSNTNFKSRSSISAMLIEQQRIFPSCCMDLPRVRTRRTYDNKVQKKICLQKYRSVLYIASDETSSLVSRAVRCVPGTVQNKWVNPITNYPNPTIMILVCDFFSWIPNRNIYIELTTNHHELLIRDQSTGRIQDNT